MELASLRTVLSVQAHGSLAGAARQMNVDPSSVSRVVAAVEAELGIRLFQRSTRRLSVTEEGASYLRRIAPLMDEIEAAREAARGQRTRPSGHLRMTASVAYACQRIVPALGAFQARFPDITVELISSDANLDLLEHNIDLAVRLAPAPTGDLVSTRLASTRYRVVASPAYLNGRDLGVGPRALGALNCLRFALPGLQDTWHFRRDDGPAFGVAVSGTLLMTNALALKQAACAGLGIALLADWLIEAELRTGQLVDVFPDHACTVSTFDTAAWALYPSRTYLPRKVRVMIDHLKEVL